MCARMGDLSFLSHSFTPTRKKKNAHMERVSESVLNEKAGPLSLSCFLIALSLSLSLSLRRATSTPLKQGSSQESVPRKTLKTTTVPFL